MNCGTMAVVVTETGCPCGSKIAEAQCCAPIIAGEPAATAEALMRSRYCAYVRGAIQHLMTTHDAKTRGDVDEKAVAAWSRTTTWMGLEILATEAGGPDDQEGVVEFIARGSTNGTAFAQRERSRFRKVEGRWYYVDGKTGNEPVRKQATPGRNDPCPCGSGMKYKRCHGA
jgi:SEC-C motif domain protein